MSARHRKVSIPTYAKAITVMAVATDFHRVSSNFCGYSFVCAYVNTENAESQDLKFVFSRKNIKKYYKFSKLESYSVNIYVIIKNGDKNEKEL